MQRIALVTVTIPVTLDSDTPPERTDWWDKAALENFMDHPALENADDLGMYVDKINFTPCDACDGKGWIVADVDSTGVLRIERCDTCERFDSDNAAVQHVASIASRITEAQ